MKKCSFCENHCGNNWCPTAQDESLEASTITPEQANKIIAEFMGGHSKSPIIKFEFGDGVQHRPVNYFESLDALMPVWEKLEFIDLRCAWIDNKYDFTLSLNDNYTYRGKTIQEAAAIATAKAIMEIEK
jgi:hypothetical protein